MCHFARSPHAHARISARLNVELPERRAHNFVPAEPMFFDTAPRYRDRDPQVCDACSFPELPREANDSVFRLEAGIWTRDYKRAWRLARALETGTVWINTYTQFSISTPFTGIKDSGLGIEKGRLGILQYKHQKSLYWGLNDKPLPWAD